MNGSTVRWGIIGAGDVAERKSGPALYETAGSRLVAVMRRDGEKAASFAQRHGAERWYDNVDALLADSEVDAVYIASPHHLHAQHVALTAATGRPILCEKPMGASLTEAEEIVRTCAAAGVPLTVAYYRRFWPIVRAIQELLEEGAIGRVVQTRVQLSDYFNGDPERPWRTSRAASGGGALCDAGSHWVDLIRLLLGDVAQVSALCSNRFAGFETEDTVQVDMEMAAGSLVSLLITLQCPIAMNEIDIAGTGGRIVVSSLSDGALTLLRPGRDPEVRTYPRIGWAHSELIAALAPSLLYGGPSPVPGSEGVAVWQVVDAAYRSCEEGVRIALS